MKTIYSEKLPRILKNKKRLEKELNVKITNRGKEVSVNGDSEDEYIAEKIIDALNFGFPFSVAMLIKKEDFLLEIINIKEHTKRHDLETVRARIIVIVKANFMISLLCKVNPIYCLTITIQTSLDPYR